MKNILIIITVGLVFFNCSTNRYVLTDENNDKDFLKLKIKEFEKSEGISNKPIVVIDGKPYRYTHELKEENLPLSKAEIKKISVLKKETGISIYGDYAKGGVIIISKFESTDKKLDRETEKSLSTLAKSGKILFFINGIEATYGEVQNINPNDIETIEVLKDESAKKLFPDKDLDGVIYIKTKK